MIRSGKVVEGPNEHEKKEKEVVNKKAEEEKEPEELEKKEEHRQENTQRRRKKADLEFEEATRITPEKLKYAPFPQRFKKQEDKKKFSKFLDVFKKLQINIPFAEALEEMPSYAKFMKEVLSKKKRFVDETVPLTEECSAIIQRKLPQKLEDPGSFSISCAIGDIHVGKALCDLGASINLMPLSIMNKLGIKDVQPTMMSLQLADRSIKYPYGIVEDLLVKVDKFIFPADFIVLDMEADKEIPLILGRPFLATGRALIDVEKGELMLRVQDEQVTFNVFKAMKHSSDRSECFMLDTAVQCLPSKIVSNDEELLNRVISDSLKPSTDHGCAKEEAMVGQVEANRSLEKVRASEELKGETAPQEEPKLELKPLPPHLRYVFLDDKETLPVIISTHLNQTEEEQLLQILRGHKEYWTSKLLNMDPLLSQQERVLKLHELEEFRLNAYHSALIYKKKTKKWHDKRIQHKKFRAGDLVLLFNSRLRLFPGKLKSKWSGPFLVEEVAPHGAVLLKELDSARTFKVNGQRLKIYHGGEIDRQKSSLKLTEP